MIACGRECQQTVTTQKPSRTSSILTAPSSYRMGIDGWFKKFACNGQPFSQKSTQYLAKIALNCSADVKSYGADRYGRVLGEVFVDGNNVNLEMVKSGLAEVYRRPPAKGQNMATHWNEEEEARKAGRGMWVLGDKYVSPREWRKTNGN